MSCETVVVIDELPGVVVEPRTDSLVVVGEDSHTVVDGEPPAVVIALSDGDDVVVAESESTQIVLASGEQGPPGPQGPIGPSGGAAFERMSAGALSALVVVWEDAAGVVRPMDYRDEDHIDLLAGITLTATSSAGPVNVQRSGPLDDSAWNWTPGRVWLGANGALTQTPPADGFDVLVGYVVSPTRIYLDMQDNIELEQ